MPSGVSERVEELVLAIDTSGSIGQRELTTFRQKSRVYVTQ